MLSIHEDGVSTTNPLLSLLSQILINYVVGASDMGNWPLWNIVLYPVGPIILSEPGASSSL